MRAIRSAVGFVVTLIQTRPPIQPHDDEGIQQVEADGRDNKQVHRSNIWGRLCRKVRHPWRGGPRRFTMYLATLD
jgi:hypothetical protein